jgi:type IX secretion system PorP/SprF family membrane protein
MKTKKQTIGRVFVVGILFVTLLAPVLTQAQQAPLFSTYFFNRYLNNPAFTGIDNQYRAFGFYRTQWTDVPGSPVTGGVTLEGAFWKNRIGVGAFVVNDKIGVFNRTVAGVSYAQKIRFAKHHQISIGIEGGAFINRINLAGTHAVQYNDPDLANQKASKAVYDFSFGIGYQWKGLLVGFSVPNVIQPNAKYGNNGSGETSYQYVRHYNIFAQYKLALLKGKFNITPTLVMRKAYASGFQADASLMFDYKNIVFVGAGYRNPFGVMVMGGVNIMDMFTVAYCYDHTTQRNIKGQVGPTHEIVAGFHLPTDYKRKKHVDAKDLMSAEDLDNLIKRDDSLSTKLKVAKRKLDESEKRANSLKEENKQLQAQLDSAKQVAQTSAAAAKAEKAANKSGGAPTPAVNFTGTVEENSSYTLNEIYFKEDDDQLLPESKKQLDQLAGYLAKNPSANIMVKGYTDNTGEDEYNYKLSLMRAKSVINYLVSKGISANRLDARGYGSQNPVAPNTTEEGRQKNRRVEFMKGK